VTPISTVAATFVFVYCYLRNGTFFSFSTSVTIADCGDRNCLCSTLSYAIATTTKSCHKRHYVGRTTMEFQRGASSVGPQKECRNLERTSRTGTRETSRDVKTSKLLSHHYYLFFVFQKMAFVWVFLQELITGKGIFKGLEEGDGFFIANAVVFAVCVVGLTGFLALQGTDDYTKDE
jgi:hypothetical protein